VGEPQTLEEPDLYLGLLAIRNEFVNLSELRHCVEVRKKIFAKSQQILSLGDVLVQQRYLTPQDLEYLRMIEQAEPSAEPIRLKDIEAEFDAQVAEIKTGTDFAGYRIEEEIGRGGMGVVFRVTDLETQEDCALKILIGGKDATVRDIERFKKEATVMAPLIHEGIVKIHAVDRQKGLDYIAMEFVDGVSLKELAGEKPVADEVSLAIIQSSAAAVGFMHSHGIIHRDIKPENIMVRPDGSAVLMDFGLAGWDKIEILAGRGSIGTPMYQPPEQADVGGPFGKISEASDVYGLGATLYFLLTGRHPFLGRSVKEVREKIKTTPPDPIRNVNPDVHPTVEALCLRCLKKRQSERFSTPKELSENIDKVLGLLRKDADRGKLDVRVQRKVAATIRKRSDGGSQKSGQGKTSAVGRVRRDTSKMAGKALAAKAPVKRGTTSGVGKVRRRPSATGRVEKLKTSGKTGARPRAGVRRPDDGPSVPIALVAVIATVLLGLVIGAIVVVS